MSLSKDTAERVFGWADLSAGGSHLIRDEIATRLGRDSLEDR